MIFLFLIPITVLFISSGFFYCYLYLFISFTCTWLQLLVKNFGGLDDTRRIHLINVLHITDYIPCATFLTE